jgi:hypothetical protein
MHKVVCELSQHVLHQYTFVLLWLLIIIGICVSLIGLIVAVLKMISTGLRVKYDRNFSLSFLNFRVILQF